MSASSYQDRSNLYSLNAVDAFTSAVNVGQIVQLFRFSSYIVSTNGRAPGFMKNLYLDICKVRAVQTHCISVSCRFPPKCAVGREILLAELAG